MEIVPGFRRATEEGRRGPRKYVEGCGHGKIMDVGRRAEVGGQTLTDDRRHSCKSAGHLGFCIHDQHHIVTVEEVCYYPPSIYSVHH